MELSRWLRLTLYLKGDYLKTVKELENQLKISKVSLYSMLKKPEFKPYVFKGENNITLVNDLGVELLKARYSKEQSETIKDIAAEEFDNSKASSKETGKDDDLLKNAEIIKILQHQLDTKDEQINNLLNIVLNQQKLEATQLLTNNKDVVNNNGHSEKSQKENFFSRIFGRR